MQKSVAFLGLGVMGFPMAGWLSKCGYAVTVYNRTESVSQRWLNHYSGNDSQYSGRGGCKCRDCV